MNITVANTEGFYRFHRSKEELARVMLASVGTLDYLANSAPLEKEGGLGLTLLPTAGEPWGTHTKWRDLRVVLVEAKKFLAQMGVIRIASAFEDFLVSSKAEYDRFENLNAKSRSRSTGMAIESPIEHAADVVALLKHIGVPVAPIEKALPLYEYFVMTRNCIAHRGSRASKALVQFASTKAVVEAHMAWRSARGKKLPSLPSLQAGEPIPLLPRHAVMAGEVCYRIAQYINRELIHILGEEGVVFMAAYHGLLSDERVRTNASNSPESILNDLLDTRYRVPNTSQNNSLAIAVLRRIGRWDQCRQAYGRLYRSVTQKRTRKRKRPHAPR